LNEQIEGRLSVVEGARDSEVPVHVKSIEEGEAGEGFGGEGSGVGGDE